MSIQIVYVHDDGQVFYQQLPYQDNMSVYDAICQTHWLQQVPFAFLADWILAHRHDDAIDQKAWYVGIFAKKCLLNTLLQDKDRVELYRKLDYDAMANRKQKALAKRKAQARLASSIKPKKPMTWA